MGLAGRAAIARGNVVNGGLMRFARVVWWRVECSVIESQRVYGARRTQGNDGGCMGRIECERIPACCRTGVECRGSGEIMR